MKATSTIKNQFLHRQPDITGNLPEQRRCEIPHLVDRNCRAPTIRVTVLNMRTALANFYKTKSFKQSANFRGLENGKRTHGQATATFCVPMNSATSRGSPSSSSIEITSRRFPLSSSKVSACEWAPGKPGTYPTSKPVAESRSITAVNVFIPTVLHTTFFRQSPKLSSPKP